MKKFSISKVSQELNPSLLKKINSKTKPLGALGFLEELALKIGLIQSTLTPALKDPHLIVFAADHGITQEGVSAYPQEVTYQMVMNFVNGGAAVNVFARQHNIAVIVVDAGVNFNFPPSKQLTDLKIDKGTRNFLKEPAMTKAQCDQAVERGARLVSQVHAKGCNVISFGEMGIGNTSSASILMSLLCHLSIEDCVGRGAGLDNEQLKSKIRILKQAMNRKNVTHPVDILTEFGGFEIAMMCGAMLQAAEHKMILLIDGFIASAAFLAAYHLCPDIMDYAVFCHESDETGHKRILEFLKAKPILKLNMRLGEGTGTAVAYPVLQSAVNFLNEMASFEQAGVSKSADKNAQRA